jgi:UDP-3-O-[3-hydroxymyristoyl] glucosamine N-acyltransferase
VVFPNCIIGKGVTIRAGAIVGGQSGSIKRDDEGRLRYLENKGGVILEDGVDIGVNTVVKRGVTGNTVIGEGSIIGTSCMIGHNSKVGKHCLILGHNFFSGWVEVGDYTQICPCCTINNRVKIGKNAFIGIGSLVMEDVADGATVVGRPAVNLERFRWERARLNELLEQESTPPKKRSRLWHKIKERTRIIKSSLTD